MLGWFVAPVVTGDYPPVMRKLVGDRLPQFTQEQAKLVKGSYDFLGINYYTSTYASNSPSEPGTSPSYSNDQDITVSSERDGIPIGPKDVPQCLEDEYGGFLSHQIVKDYCEFAELCFWEFGYALGTFPPGRGPTSTEPVKAIPRHRCKLDAPTSCSNGNQGTEPYIVGHHLIISHAAAVDIYKQRYKAHQGEKIGVTNVAQRFEPLTDTIADKEAPSRVLNFILGW
ncbi:unnamed protein product [Fraxinus pennsylvanica]|uniref:Uncharacterized protein n=1 Tax=Fraxinus pennsylvanica TaxID=56036 RepID=A0AAD1Z1P5_9LAMI|nr:unnamed protein product [Fraxinus pennsylvanica]